MPMDLGQIELELDAVEARGAGRLPQETPRSGGTQSLSPHPEGIHPNLMEHKMQKTEAAIEARITQVTRREREPI